MMGELAYAKQLLGPVDETRPCGSIGDKRASVGTGEGASLCKALESLVDGLNPMGPGEVRGYRSMRDGILHAVQYDPANTGGEHWGDRVRIWVGNQGMDNSLLMR
jgi:hypothetical protein